MSKQVFDQIEKGLREALTLVKGKERIPDQKANLPAEAEEFSDQYAHAREGSRLNQSRP